MRCCQNIFPVLYYSQNPNFNTDALRETGTYLDWFKETIADKKEFDTIRETDQFKAILADAEAFEKGEYAAVFQPEVEYRSRTSRFTKKHISDEDIRNNIIGIFKK